MEFEIPCPRCSAWLTGSLQAKRSRDSFTGQLAAGSGATCPNLQPARTLNIGKIVNPSDATKSTMNIGRIVEPPGFSRPSPADAAPVAPDTLYIWSQTFPAAAYSADWYEYRESSKKFHCWVCHATVDSQHVMDAVHPERIAATGSSWSWNAYGWASHHKQQTEKQV